MELDWQQLYAVDPIKDCPHCIELDYELFVDKKFNEKCIQCDNVGENWICLECQQIFCSRYVNGHMVEVMNIIFIQLYSITLRQDIL